jgi:hypothetical protein
MADTMTTWKIVFVCDNRGRHKEQVVYTRNITVDDIAAVPARAVSLASPGEVFELSCRLCPRTPRLRYPAAVKLAEHALAEFRGGKRRVKVNISGFPF